MSPSFVLLFALLAFSAYVRAEEEVDESNVVVLTSDNFDSTLSENEFVLVEFYAPWCGHCKRLIPEYAQAATDLKEDGIVLGKVDATVESDLAGKFGVRGYPTLKWFRGGKASDYTGQRTAPEIAAWCRKKSGPPSKELKADEVADFVADKAAVVGTFKSRESDAYKAFIEVAKDGDLDDFVFADVTGDDEGIKLYTTFADAQDVDADDAKAFILQNGYPLVDELPGAWERYSKKGLPLAILFVDPAKDNKALLAKVTAAAEKSVGKLSFSFADGIRFKQQIERMGGDPEVVPGIAAMKLDGKANYPYKGELETDDLAAWAAGIADGSIKPFLKSEPIPEDNSGPVTVVVGKNFKETVSGDKDVLLEIYAPWCGHCKSLAPIYEELGEAYADNEKIVIAKIDGTANDFDVEYRGFPTIKFFPAGGEMMDYEGGRTLDEMKAFIEKNAVNASGEDSEAADEGKDEL